MVCITNRDQSKIIGFQLEILLILRRRSRVIVRMRTTGIAYILPQMEMLVSGFPNISSGIVVHSDLISQLFELWSL